MNVLGKIVIPRTNATSKYILNELEEMAREEFFRLKKVLEIERRMFGGDEKEKKEEPVTCTTCEAGPEWGVIERCVECGALLLPEGEKTEKEGDEKIEEYKAHLSEILNITKDMDEQGIITASVEEFVKTAEELKDKLEQKPEKTQSTEGEKEPYDEHLNHLCEDCKKIYLEEKAAKKKAEEGEPESEVTESEPVEPPQPLALLPPPPILPPLPSAPPPTPPPPPHVAYETPDLELGTFETEVKEITKVIRVRKEDGSISEEKKVIKIKKEVRTPIRAKAVPQPSPINQERAGRITYEPSGTSGSSSKSNHYSGSRTVGVVTTKSLDPFPFSPKIVVKRVQSQILQSPMPMSDPVIRHCMSSVTLLSVDFGEYSPSYVNSIEYEELKGPTE